MSWPCLGLRLLLLAAGPAGVSEEKKPIPLYTNDDLERVSPHRDETGVNSKVIAAARPAASDRAAEDGRARSEAYWRRQAEHLHVRLQRARERIDEMRARIAEGETASRSPSRRTRTSNGAQLDAWRRQLAALEARVRDEEARFEDRARREGALPGWLR
jgi:hypothetical protein